MQACIRSKILILQVCTSNVNRQVHALTGEIGKMKIEVMAERVARINPKCKVMCLMCCVWLLLHIQDKM